MSADVQPELFARGPAAPVDLAPEAEPLQDLAARIPPGVRLGTSSWAFPGWEGIVYDREASRTVLARHGLRAYARHPLLRCVGLDRGYYAPVPPRELAELRRQTPDDFRFVLKADRTLVLPSGPEADPGRFLDPAWAEDAVVAPAMEALGPTLGAILVQFPPLDPGVVGGPRRFAESLYRFLDALPAGAPMAVEVRSPGLLTADYAAALHHGGAGHGYVVHPEMSSLERQSSLIPPDPDGFTVIRWMLKPGHSYGAARDAWAPFHRLASPDPVRRGEVAALARMAVAAGGRALVVVNNKAEGSSPLSILELVRALDDSEDATV